MSVLLPKNTYYLTTDTYGKPQNIWYGKKPVAESGIWIQKGGGYAIQNSEKVLMNNADKAKKLWGELDSSRCIDFYMFINIQFKNLDNKKNDPITKLFKENSEYIDLLLTHNKYVLNPKYDENILKDFYIYIEDLICFNPKEINKSQKIITKKENVGRELRCRYCFTINKNRSVCYKCGKEI